MITPEGITLIDFYRAYQNEIRANYLRGKAKNFNSYVRNEHFFRLSNEANKAPVFPPYRKSSTPMCGFTEYLSAEKSNLIG